MPPTPATGMRKARLPSEPESDIPDRDSDWDLGESPPAARLSRPSAPPLFLNKHKSDRGLPAGERHTDHAGTDPDLAGLDESEAPPELAALEAGDKVRCDDCGALSPKNYRFCVSCGAIVQKKVAKKKKRRKPAQEPRVPKAPRTPDLELPAQRVVAVEEDGAAEVAKRVNCERCGGSCDANEAFCKFCGAPLRKAKGKPIGRVDVRKQKRKKPAEEAEFEPTRKLAGDVDDEEPFPLEEQKSAEQAEPPRREKARAGRKKPAREEPSGQLVVIVEDGSEGKAIDLIGPQVDIGSYEGDILLTEDRYLSPRHARFFRQDGNWYLRDLSSLNGVYRRLRKPGILKDGDLVLLGLEVLQFGLVDHAERGLGHAMQHNVLVFGSPAATRRARLCQRTVEGVVRDVYHLLSDETTIGREIGDIVFTSDPFMSRRHAAIRWQESTQEYVLADLNSSNGTYLAIREDVRLDNGDFIRLGQHLFRVDLPGRGRGGR